LEIIPKEQNIIPAIFENKEIRIIQKNGEPWFVAKDVAEILEIKNVSDAVKDLDSDEKDIVLNDTLGGVQEMLILSEPDVSNATKDLDEDERGRFKIATFGGVQEMAIASKL
jgi:prophage antirepressor-like protein